jgi:hypothetical protein
VTLVDGAPPSRIVGSAAVPAHQEGEFGHVAWFGAGAFTRLGVEGDRYLYLTAAPGVPASELDRVSGAAPPFQPPNLRNLRQIGAIPYVLGAFLGLLGLASLVHALLVAVRGRRRELAVLRSLGFVRGQVRRTIAWQSSSTIVVGVVIGGPLGLIVGTWVWRRIAASLGTPADVSVPLGALALVVAGALLAAGLAALVPARRAERIRPAEVLRGE